MKKLYYFIICLLSVCLLFSSCQDKPASNNTSGTQDSTSSIKTDDSVWYSEKAGVLGRIWLGMTEKEVYDVLIKYNITIIQPYPNFEYDEYGAMYRPPECYYKKLLHTEGYQYFWFDKDDRLCEISYVDQMHYTSPPINKEFEAQRGVQRRGKYQDMIDAYGKPDKIITIYSSTESYMYRLENGDYLHFVYQGITNPIESIRYSKYPYLFSLNY